MDKGIGETMSALLDFAIAFFLIVIAVMVILIAIGLGAFFYLWYNDD
jgi:hypothetical protein